MSDYKPDKYQQAAIEAAVKEKILIITGGPGTGKSTTVNRILEELNLPWDKIALAAPTGKAARRLSESCFGRPASTIHRLLGYSPTAGGFTMDEDHPLSEDVLIIDEVSMMDVLLMMAFLNAVKPSAKLIFVGDKDQLPSVGPGNVLRDMIASGNIPVCELKQIHRQSEHSWISLNAQKINAGIAPHIDPQSEDFFIRFIEDAKDVRTAIVETMKHIAEEHGLSPFRDIQLLCPQRNGVLGIFGDKKNQGLNEELQSVFNPGEDGQAEYRGFRVPDKVIHTKNNYQLCVFNGESGQVIDVDVNNKKLTVDYGDRTIVYNSEDVNDLKHAYAITIHKSQGSEWPAVVVPLHHTNQFMLNRNLAYTAITRGKRFVYVLCDKRGLKKAVTAKGNKRNTGLADRLKEVFDGAEDQVEVARKEAVA